MRHVYKQRISYLIVNREFNKSQYSVCLFFNTGIDNIDFHRGDAAHLPFGDASFDLAVTRLAIHHFDKPANIVEEMKGKVKIIESVHLKLKTSSKLNVQNYIIDIHYHVSGQI